MATSNAAPAALLDALQQIRDPLFPAGIPATWVTLEGTTATLQLPFAAGPGVLALLNSTAVCQDYQWQLVIKPETLRNSQPEMPRMHGNVVVISSGKGGVGKSSATVQLALALQQLGARVGVLDADIYGPSIPTMLGKANEPLQFTEDNKMIPHDCYGLQVNSLGYLTGKGDAAIWRGPMASAALQQLFRDTKWQPLDYLLVDMPPGTGDIQLTFAQKLPITGAVVVTTPQNVALADAEKGIAMFRKVNIPISGVLENMSYFECSQCGHQEPIFGRDGGAHTAAEQKVPLLGQWPLATRMQAALDVGKPLLASNPDDALCEGMRRSAELLAASLYYQAKQ